MGLIRRLVVIHLILVCRVQQLLGPPHFLTGMDKWCPLGSQNHEVTQTNALMNFSRMGLRILLNGLGNNIVQGQVVVGSNVLNHVTRCICNKVTWVGNNIIEDLVDIAWPACQEARLPFRWVAGLEFVTDLIGEDRHTVGRPHPVLVGRLNRITFVPDKGPPTFPKHEDLRIEGASCPVSLGNGFSIMVPHHVEAEAVHLEGVGPVFNGIH